MFTNENIAEHFYDAIIGYFRSEINNLVICEINKCIVDKDFDGIINLYKNEDFICEVEDLSHKYKRLVPAEILSSIPAYFVQLFNNEYNTDFVVGDIHTVANENVIHRELMKCVAGYIRHDNDFTGKESSFYYSVDGYVTNPSLYKDNRSVCSYIGLRCVYDILFMYVSNTISPLFYDFENMEYKEIRRELLDEKYSFLIN